MSQDLSIFNLVLHATFVVQVVMVGLLAVSVVSWSMIFGKVFSLQKTRTLNESFEREFWSGKNLAELNQAA
ncbi:MAG TPA: protein TolQ, partial [Burkholderiaceae bacterium]|nr:protein TolQ [Burkholderiaceae bacterium]